MKYSPAKERRMNQVGTAVLIWYNIEQTSFCSTGSAALCDTGAAADSDAAPLMCRTIVSREEPVLTMAEIMYKSLIVCRRLLLVQGSHTVTSHT